MIATEVTDVLGYRSQVVVAKPPPWSVTDAAEKRSFQSDGQQVPYPFFILHHFTRVLQLHQNGQMHRVCLCVVVFGKHQTQHIDTYNYLNLYNLLIKIHLNLCTQNIKGLGFMIGFIHFVWGGRDFQATSLRWKASADDSGVSKSWASKMRDGRQQGEGTSMNLPKGFTRVSLTIVSLGFQWVSYVIKLVMDVLPMKSKLSTVS